ncbi:MAG: SulP family inorganic anion transporter [Tenacibaculum sp.]|nr:SulP family inorganic anion transporter [Tenacibaculum sp.]
MNKVLEFFDLNQKINWRVEILAGLTVAMTMIPESLSFAILAGFPPLSGLYAAFIAGLVAALFGGRPGLVSGGAGATVVTLIALIQSHGLEYAFAAVALAGVIQIIVGIFKWAKYIRLVPESVMYGFVNGLAVIIFSAQLEQFYQKGEGGKNLLDATGQHMLLEGMEFYIMAGLVALTVATTFLFPKVTKKFPASLFAIILVFAIVLIFGIDTRTVGDISPVSGSLPPFHIPMVPLTWETFVTILPYGAVVAAVGLTEGLLTLNLVDEITETKGNGSREALAQGASNILNGLFTGMGGCPMIAQTLVNLEAGSRTRIAGVVGAITILIIILVAAPVIELIPMAALTGVMMVVAFFTFKWSSFVILNKMPVTDVIVMLIVTAVTIIWHNLAVAVLIGILISALSFAWKKANSIRSNQKEVDGVKTYELHGPLFFGAVTAFEEMFSIKEDPNSIIIDFKHSVISDMSAIETLNKVSNKYKDLGKEVKIINLNEKSIKLLKRAANLVKLKFEE